MGRLTLILGLAVRDLRHRRAESVLLLAIAAATTTLTLGLALSGVTGHPYQQTRAATRGLEVVASFLNLGQPRGVTAATGLAALRTLAKEPGVTGSSGPFPVSWPSSGCTASPPGCWPRGAVPRPQRLTGRN